MFNDYCIVSVINIGIGIYYVRDAMFYKDYEEEQLCFEHRDGTIECFSIGDYKVYELVFE